MLSLIRTREFIYFVCEQNRSYAGDAMAGKNMPFTVIALVNKRDTFSVGFPLCITFMASVHPYPKFRSCSMDNMETSWKVKSCSMENFGFAHLLNCNACVIESNID